MMSFSCSVLQVDLDEFRQVVRQALDLELVHHVRDDAAAGLHAGRDLRVHEVQRHVHVDLLVRVDALEVDVQDLLLPRMHLEVAQEHAVAARRRRVMSRIEAWNASIFRWRRSAL